MVAHGIEVEDVMVFPIPRRTDTMNLVTDSYHFCPNDDMEAIDALELNTLTEYIEVSEICY